MMNSSNRFYRLKADYICLYTCCVVAQVRDCHKGPFYYATLYEYVLVLVQLLHFFKVGYSYLSPFFCKLALN